MSGPVAGRLALLATVKERPWREQVLSWARDAGWAGYFTWNSTHSPAGFPDLVLVRPPRVLIAELKTEKGRLTASQEWWLGQLVECDQLETHVWRPHDETAIQDVLWRDRT